MVETLIITNYPDYGDTIKFEESPWREPNTRYWINIKGELISLYDMPDDYLENCIKMCKRNGHIEWVKCLEKVKNSRKQY